MSEHSAEEADISIHAPWWWGLRLGRPVSEEEARRLNELHRAEREYLAQVMHDTYERARTPGGWLNIADAVIAAGYRRPSAKACVTCGEPLTVVPGLGIVGIGGVCRNEMDPTCTGFDNEGQHIYPPASTPEEGTR